MALIHFIFIALLSLQSPRLYTIGRYLADVETTTEKIDDATTTIESTEIPETTTSSSTAPKAITLDISR